MKKILATLAACAAVAFLLTGCQKENADNITSGTEAGTVTRYIGVSIDPVTKTSLDAPDGGSASVVWSEGDAIGVAVSGTSTVRKATLASGAGTSTATFAIQNATEDETYSYVIYPYAYAGEGGSETPSIDGSTFSVTLPSRQPFYVADGAFGDKVFASDVNTMAGKVDAEGNVTLKSVCGILAVQLTGTSDAGLSAIYLTSASQKMSGPATIDMSADAPTLTMSSSALGYVYKSAGEDLSGQTVALSATARTVYFVLPVADYADISIITTVGSGTKMLSSTVSHSVTKNVIRKLPAYNPLTADAATNVLVIADTDDMATFATYNSQSKSSGVTAIVVNDIDMSSTTWTALTNWYGTLDGLGHRVSGLTASLFGNLYGTVKNLTVSADIDYTTSDSYGTDYGVGILAHYAYCYIGGGSSNGATGAYIDNVTAEGSVTSSYSPSHAFHVGGVVGCSNGVPLSNCTNKASVTWSGTVSGAYNVNVGGIAGLVQILAANLSVCSNEGAVTFSGTAGTSDATVGGVAGRVNVASAISDCTNSGDVTFSGSASAVFRTGGIVGYVNNASAKLTGGTNGGAVTVSGTSTASISTGGVAGDSKGAVTSCTNEGDVLFSGNSGGIPRIGGVIGYKECALSDGINKGKVTFSGTGTSNALVGGVLGGSTATTTGTLTNSGDVTVDGASAYYIFLGGVFGSMDSPSLTGLGNSGAVKMSSATVSAGTGVAVGGIGGQTNGASQTLSSLTNEGPVTVGVVSLNGVTSCRYDVGGVLGYAYRDAGAGTFSMSKLSNKGAVTVSGISTASAARVGGVVGNLVNIYSGDNSTTFTDNTNTGDISITGGSSHDVFAGGLVGNLRASGTFSGSGCTNGGDVTVTGYAGSAQLVLGGLYGLVSMYKPSGSSAESLALAMTLSGTNTNSGKIGLYEDTTDSTRPVAGGIVGMVYGTSSLIPSLSVEGASNSGAIERTLTGVTEQSLARTGSSNYQYLSCAGGIVGSAGYYYTGGDSNCYQDVTLNGCTNSGSVQFNRKPSLTSTVAVEKNGDGENVYTGGIVGMSFAATGHTVTVSSCTNRGNILSTYGKNGGIAGFMRSGTAITGTSSAYTVNSGKVGHQGSAIGSPGTPYGYMGGIVGYLFGDSSNSIEWCSVESGCWVSSNYGCGLIAGQLVSGSSTGEPSVSHVKLAGVARPSSTAAALYGNGKGGFIAGNCENSKGFTNMSHIAVGGSVYRYASSAWSAIAAASSGEWYKCLVATGSYAPGYDSSAKTWDDGSAAAALDITQWDGTSALSWE